MRNRKNNKRALIVSALSLLLCVSMLVGSTMAWFTDNATVSANKVQAGTLDIELYKQEWADAFTMTSEVNITDSTEPLFNHENWEPGYLDFTNITVKNAGSLAAKVRVTINPVGEVGKLAEVIDVYVSRIPLAKNYEDGKYSIRDYIEGKIGNSGNPVVDAFIGSTYKDKLTKVGTLADIINNGLTLTNDEIMEAGDDVIQLGIALKMQESAGNIYQGETAGTFDILVQAAQATVESDSYDDQYDVKAEYDDSILVSNEESLASAFAEAAEGGEPATIMLVNDIVVDGDRLPVGTGTVVMDLNGKTIKVEGTGSAATDRLFYTQAGANLTITGNGTIDFGSSSSSIAVGGYAETITIENGTFIRDRYTNADEFYPLIENTKNAPAGTKFIINGGYFDSGYYNLKEDGTPDCFNNCRQLINSTWSNCDIVVYGGTFVGANPAWGDEGMAHLCTVCGGNTYCQQLFLAGQNREDTELPAGYTITEGKLEDGRPTFSVSYTAP